MTDVVVIVLRSTSLVHTHSLHMNYFINNNRYALPMPVSICVDLLLSFSLFLSPDFTISQWTDAIILCKSFQYCRCRLRVRVSLRSLSPSLNSFVVVVITVVAYLILNPFMRALMLAAPEAYCAYVYFLINTTSCWTMRGPITTQYTLAVLLSLSLSIYPCPFISHNIRF